VKGGEIMTKYDLGSSSDMKRFENDLQSAITDKAKEVIKSKTFSVECPKCKAKLNLPSGLSRCPNCGNEIKIQLNFNL
jgi:Zn finger protein HypA/HybF involved in hydrogenase expression